MGCRVVGTVTSSNLPKSWLDLRGMGNRRLHMDLSAPGGGQQHLAKPGGQTGCHPQILGTSPRLPMTGKNAESQAPLRSRESKPVF